MMSIPFHTTIVVLTYNTLDMIGKILSFHMVFSNKSISIFVFLRLIFIPVILYVVNNDIHDDYWILMGLNAILSVT